MILAVVIDGDGRPVCSEMCRRRHDPDPGNRPAAPPLRHRARVRGRRTVVELEARRLLYILGLRERSDKLVRELVLDDPAPFVPLLMSKRGKQVDYEAKAVSWGGRRYIVGRNHQEAENDAADRASIVAALSAAQAGRQDARRQCRLPPLYEGDQRGVLRDRSRKG